MLKRVYNEDKLVVITDSYGLDTDGLDFNQYYILVSCENATF